MLVLTIPWLLVILIIVLIVCLIKKKWRLLFLLTGVLLALNWWSECFPLRLWPLSENGSDCSIKVMSFNIDGSVGDINIKAPEVAKLIVNYAPDVVFIAEFCEQDVKALDTLLANMYPYSTVNRFRLFNYFYSKYPLKEVRKLKYSNNNHEIDIYACKILISGDSLLLYGCHLPSNNYTSELKSFPLDSIKTGSDVLSYSRNIRNAYNLRAKQTELLLNDMKGYTMPVIVMGDMNDVGGSAALRKMEQSGLQDAWWKGGCGYGATIQKPLPYRIDHILYSTGLKLKEIKVVDSKGMSDHDALYAEFMIKK